jgi:hypothetical protein
MRLFEKRPLLFGKGKATYYKLTDRLLSNIT